MDWRVLGPNHFECAAQWPRGHRVFRTRDGGHDPLLIAETLRQAGILLCHTAYGVPEGARFLMDRIGFDADPCQLADVGEPAEVVVRVHAAPPRRTRLLTQVSYDYEFSRSGQHLARGVGGVRCVAPALYERIRARATQDAETTTAASPVKPWRVGLTDYGDVAIGERSGPATVPMRVPMGHPVHFEHPLDHVPGMLVLESIRQATRVLLDRPEAQPIAAKFEFHRFLELDLRSEISALMKRADGETVTLDISVVQGGQCAAEGTLVVAGQGSSCSGRRGVGVFTSPVAPILTNWR